MEGGPATPDSSSIFSSELQVSIPKAAEQFRIIKDSWKLYPS